MQIGHEFNGDVDASIPEQGHAAVWALPTQLQERFSYLESEHKLALNMLQSACTHLQELLQENKALRLQNQQLKDYFARSQGLHSDTHDALLHGMAFNARHNLPSPSSDPGAFEQRQWLASTRDAELLPFLEFARRSQESLRHSFPPRATPSTSISSDSYSAALGRAPSGASGSSLLTESRPVSKAASDAVFEEGPRDVDVPRTALAGASSDLSYTDFMQGMQSLQRFNLQPDLHMPKEYPMRAPQPGVSSSPQQLPKEPSGGSRKSFEPWMTTIVVRNIPARYTQERLLEIWEPDGSYNFLYLPYSVRQKRGAGYVFINFCTHEAAVAFWQKVQGTRLPGCEHLKCVDIAVADVQGLEENLRYWSNRKLGRISNSNFLPIVLDGTQRVDFKQHVAHFGFGSGRTASVDAIDDQDAEDIEPPSVML
eukprot:TRINITY_DN38039_c0_g2_i1.p1 TRINITY_DN38039_c0_g2~~TRINITY_DN38039_c0_g2_i1.p1  ORF type:complete len:426 (-),score=64.35 TRINITY_DN38039_c0_g2_i1:23-1300(-)